MLDLNIRILFAVIVLVSFVNIDLAEANECDNISQRYKPIMDSKQTFNAIANKKLDDIVKEFNDGPSIGYSIRSIGKKKSASACDLNLLEYLLQDKFITVGYIGTEEMSANFKSMTGAIDSHLAGEDNIYRDPSYGKIQGYPSKYYASALSAGLPLAPSINIDGHYICTDKLGHFFSEGKVFYQQYQTQFNSKKNEKEQTFVKDGLALKSSLSLLTRTEYGNYGVKTTHVFSNGDLAADFGGGLFWFSAMSLKSGGVPESLKKTFIGKNENIKGPYFSCENGKLQRTGRVFDWGDYVNDAWDEGINCSEMDTKYDGDKDFDKNAKLKENILALETRNPGQRFQCPAKDSCRELISQYGNFLSERLLSARCLKSELFMKQLNQSDYKSTPDFDKAKEQLRQKKVTAIKNHRYQTLQNTCWFLESDTVDRTYYKSDDNLSDVEHSCKQINWSENTPGTDLQNSQK
jgi:hypothetical protein